MYNFKKTLLNYTLLVFVFISISKKSLAYNTPYLDSLYKAWKNTKLPDSIRLKAIDDFIWDGFLFTNPDSALYFAQLQYNFAKFNGNKKYIAISLKNQGIVFGNQGDYDKAIMSHMLSLKICQTIGDKNGMSAAYGNIGQELTLKGKYSEALTYYFTALKMGEELGDKTRIANQLLNIGTIYQEISNYSKALDYYDKSLKTYEEINSDAGVAKCYTNIGTIYIIQDNLDKSKDCFFKALPLSAKVGDEKSIAYSYFSLAEICFKKIQQLDSLQYSSKLIAKITDSLTKEAFEYSFNSIKIAEKISDKYLIAASYGALGKLYFQSKKYDLAEEIYKKSLNLSIEQDAIGLIKNQHQGLSDLYEAINNYQLAFYHYKKFVTFRDLLLNENNSRFAFQKELEHSYDKKETANIVRRQEEKKVIDAQFQKEKAQRIALYGGLTLTVVFLFFIFNRLKITKNQKKIIELQKQETEQQNKEITASIRYAKRIQSAILPSDATINSSLKDSFVVYKPKDIVAGDFYWLEEIDDNIIFAAADCTGHGVPGAMVSVVCNNALNRCVREFGITHPGLILDKSREIIISEFQKSDEELQDGMDISLCTLDKNKSKLLWAGANNPLWIIRNNELIEVKPDKQPIGKYSHQKTFTTHVIDIQKNDMLYIFTDGYQDQFGGEYGKKFKISNLKSFLLSIQDKNLEQQKEIINSTFEKWKGSNEQVDDVCMIGVKI